MPKPVIDKEKCTDCSSCISICPMGVFGKENNSIVVKNSKDCIGCKACEVQCAEGAIKVENG